MQAPAVPFPCMARTTCSIRRRRRRFPSAEWPSAQPRQSCWSGDFKLRFQTGIRLAAVSSGMCRMLTASSHQAHTRVPVHEYYSPVTNANPWRRRCVNLHFVGAGFPAHLGRRRRREFRGDKRAACGLKEPVAYPRLGRCARAQSHVASLMPVLNRHSCCPTPPFDNTKRCYRSVTTQPVLSLVTTTGIVA